MVTVAGSADQKLIERWDSNLKACQSARIRFEQQWHKNYAFYSGRQYIAVTQNSGGAGFSITDTRPAESWRVRHTANRILRIIRTEITKLNKEEPQFYCNPKSMDESDRLAAMAGDSIAEFILRTKYFNKKRLMATFWASICGTGFLKNYYDPNKLELDGLPGRIDFEALSPLHLFVPNLTATELEDQPYVVHARTLSPEDVYSTYGVEMEPGTDSIGLLMESRFLTTLGINNKSQETKQCYVKEVYVKACKDFPNGAMFVYGDNRILYVHEAQDEMEQLPTVGEAPEQLELELELPAEPVGRNVPGFSNTVAPKDDNPEELPVGKSVHDGLQNYDHTFGYRHGRFPFAKIDHIPTGFFYGESVIKSLISSQKEYNRTRSISLEYRNLAQKPQWAFVKGAFDPKKFTGKPGLLLDINMGFEPPKPLEQPQEPPSLSNQLETILMDMDDAASNTEITKGRTPPGVEAASAIAYLSEENDTVLGHTITSLENAVQETGIQVLANVHDFWPEDRIVRMTSKNEYAEVREFKASDLQPLMDFRVEANSMAPRSLAAKQAFITELMKMGAIEPTKALRYLQMSETDKLYDDLMVDVRHAQRENVYMSKGQPLLKVDIQATNQAKQSVLQMMQNPALQEDPEAAMMLMQQSGLEIDMESGQLKPIYKTDTVLDPMTGEEQTDEQGMPVTYQVTTNPFDAHEVHIEEHQKFQKTQEYELLPPETQLIIQDHVDEHKMAMLKENQALYAKQAFEGQVAEQVTPAEEQVNPRELQDA